MLRDTQIKLGIEAENQAGDNGNGERDNKACAIHARFV
jgi:hypothetical protein